MGKEGAVKNKNSGDERAPTPGGTMFLDVEEPFSFGGWVLQSLLAYFGPVAAVAILSGATGAADTALWQISGYGFILFLASAAALMVSVLVPSHMTEGCRVWAVPLLTELIVLAAALHSKGLSGVRSLFYISAAPMGGEAAWGVALLTLPTWSCVWYSVTMHYRYKRARLNQRS